MIKLVKKCIFFVFNCDIFVFKFAQSCLWKCLLIVFVLLHFCCSSYQQCLSEEFKTFDQKEVKWLPDNNTEEDNYIVFSSPPCVDINNELLTRKCLNGSWYPSSPPKCHQVIDNNIKCFNNLYETEFCTYITKPVAWTSFCDFTNTNIQTYIKPTINLRYIWLPVRRMTNFGPYVYVTLGEKYGELVSSNYKYSTFIEDIYNKDCILFDLVNNTLLPEYCDRKHPLICAWDRNFHWCPDNCVSAGIGTKECYCKIFNESCTKYANIMAPYQKQILQDYVGNHVCRIGNNQIITKNYWKEGNDEANCSICMRHARIQYLRKEEQVKLLLFFNEDNRKLSLLVYSPENISRSAKTKNIYCFTNAGKELLKKVKLKIIYHYKIELFDPNEEVFDAYDVELEEYMGNYYCEAYTNSSKNKIVSNNVVAYKKKKGNEFALRLLIESNYDQFVFNYKYQIPKVVENIFDKAIIRVMKIFSGTNNNTFEFLLHISMKKNNNVIGEYYKFKKKIEKELEQVVYFRSSEYCIPEKTNEGKVKWPLSTIGQSVLPKNVDRFVNFPIRVCQGNFLDGAYWYDLNDTNINEKPSPVTAYLYNLTMNPVTTESIGNVLNVIKEENLNILDIYYLSEFLKLIYKEDINKTILQESFRIINKIYQTDELTLSKTQLYFNTTDEILDSMEDILSKSNFTNSKVNKFENHYTLVYITNPFLSNISGLYITLNKSNNFVPHTLKINETFNDIVNVENINLAFYVPSTVLDQIYNKSSGNISDIKLIITIFKNDRFFASESEKSPGLVLSIKIPGYGNYLQKSIPVLFKINKIFKNAKCGFWDYGKRTTRHKGKWSTVGSNYLGHFLNDNSTYVCSFTHLTHFALLIARDQLIFDSNSEHYYVLTVLASVGVILTVVGFTGIVLTALIFEAWRKRQGTKILLHLSVAISLEAVCVQIAEINDVGSHSNCIIIGMLLHYMILSKFCWMLIYAYLQYLRFVKVLGPRPNKLVFKSIIFGWGFGIIPVFFVSVINLETYSNYLCYPRGISLYLGIFVPILLIILINSIIFCIVMYEICNNKKVSSTKSDSQKLQLKLAILLFFVFGIPWIFGILAEFVMFETLQIIFNYLFCITTAIDEFTLFLFYVVLNKETQTKWLRYIKIKHCKL